MSIVINQPIILGKIGSSYGIYGWQKIYSFTEHAENIFNYKPWFIKKENNWLKLNLEDWKRCNHYLIVKFSKTNNLLDPSILTNYEIIIDASQLPNLNNDEYYWKDLIYCNVFNINGSLLGNIINIIETGSNDILVLKKINNFTKNTKIFIPFIYGEIIKNINLTKHIVYVDWNSYY